MTGWFERAGGILLHPTSLPGPHGIGDLGGAAHRFVDFLADAGLRLWQVLPVGPTGYGDSPYASFSTFAGNPLLVSLERLVEDGEPAGRGDRASGVPRRPGRFRQAHSLEARPARPRRAPVPLHGDRRAARGLRALLGDGEGVARRLRTVHGGQGPARRAGPCDGTPRLDGVERLVGPGHRGARARGARPVGPRGSRRRRLGEGGAALVLPPVDRPARARGGARRQDRGRRPDLRGAGQRRRVGRSPSLPPRPGPPADRGVRGAAGLLQRDRPALGQPDLRLAPDGTRRVRVVDRAPPRGARASSTRCGWTTSAGSRPAGRCRRASRRRFTGGGRRLRGGASSPRCAGRWAACR